MSYNNSEPSPETNLRGYLFFLVGQWTSILGSNIVQFGIIWFLTVETGSSFVLGLAAFLGFAPFLLVTPIAGVFVDRYNRKKIILFVDFMQAFFTLILIVFFMFDNIFSPFQLIVVILGITMIRGVFGAFHTSAVDTLLPIMVPKDKLSRINGVNYLANGAIFIVGPIVGAVALKIVSLKILLWLDVITFLIAIIPTIIVFIPKILKIEQEELVKPSFKSEFYTGFNFIRETTGLFTLLMLFVFANFFLTPIFVQLPLLVTSIHFGDELNLAFLMSLQQVGLISSSFIMSTWKVFDKHVVGVVVGMSIGYIGVIITVLAPVGNFAVMGIGVFMLGFLLPIVNVSSETIWAATVPREILGRVYSVRRTVAQISNPIATLLVGILAEIVGLVQIITIFAVCGIVLLIYTWFFTSLSSIEKSIEESRNDKTLVTTPDEDDRPTIQ